MGALLGPGIGLGPVTLFLHETTETVLVDLDPLLCRHLEGQLDREAVGVVQRERLVARQGALDSCLGH